MGATMEIIEEKEVLSRPTLDMAHLDQGDIRIQGDWESNHFRGEDGEMYYPVIWRGQRFKRKAWRRR